MARSQPGSWKKEGMWDGVGGVGGVGVVDPRQRGQGPDSGNGKRSWWL